MAFDLQTFLVTATSTFGISMAGAYWLSQALINHRLARALEDHKSELLGRLEDKKAALQAELARDKAQVEGAVKREIELQLGDRAAQRQYEYEARKRLYLAIGPLRFQLLLACRDCAGRIAAHGRRESGYALDLHAYYGQSTLYRLLRPLAIAELIEREIAYTDFTVDASALDCLRFKKAALRALSGDDVVGSHPAIDWKDQVQHAYADSLAVCALALVRETDKQARVQRFNEFRQGLQQDAGLAAFDPFPKLFADFSIRSKTILWTRLVAYSHLCATFVRRAGGDLGFDVIEVPVRDLVLASGDAWFTSNIDATVEQIEALLAMKL